ncbi:MAG: transporter permease, putative transport system permease protein [Candidatus Saccharibacteria bacterium]|nr:transporter permease, putative transport system permease protein [Candidatus Saccharibacteria bacterium]
MNSLTRGIRNTFRNSIRTVSIVLILGLSIGLSLSMLVARQAVENKISTVKSTIGTSITVSPAGARGFDGGGEPLTQADLDKAKSVAHVTSVSGTLQDRLSSDNTNLQSAIDPGTLGRRFGRSNSGFGAGGQAPNGGTFKLPVMLIGTDDPASAQVLSGSSVKLTSGTLYAAGSSDKVAVIGKELATKNNLSVGSTFTAYASTITVVGIYDAGNTFSNGTVVMPLKTVQTLSSQANAITSAIIKVDSIDTIDGAVNNLKTQLGSKADVVSQKDTATQALAPLQNIKNVSLFSLIGAMVAGAIIILLTMVMIVRERRREIGVLKAIGASNVKIMWQFMAEAVSFTVIGAVLGIAIGLAGGKPITNMLVTNSSNASSAVSQTAGPGQGPVTAQAGGGGLFRRAASNLNLKDVHAVISWHLLLYGFAAAVLIALVGSAVPSLLIAKIRPAEVMRTE